jgi:hypothetical protein
MKLWAKNSVPNICALLPPKQTGHESTMSSGLCPPADSNVNLLVSVRVECLKGAERLCYGLSQEVSCNVIYKNFKKPLVK